MALSRLLKFMVGASYKALKRAKLPSGMQTMSCPELPLLYIPLIQCKCKPLVKSLVTEHTQRLHAYVWIHCAIT